MQRARRQLGLFLAPLGAALWSSCAPPEPPPPPAPRPVRVAPIQQVSTHPTVSASGFVEAWSVRRLAVAAEGRLQECAAVGASFAAGDTIARLDANHYRLALDRAQATHDVAAAVLREIEAGARADELLRVEEQVAEVKAQLAQGEADLARAEDLRRRGTFSQFEYDQASTKRNVLAAQLRQAEAALRLLREGASAEQRALGRARVLEAEAEVSRARARLDDAALVAPGGGVVSETYAELGEQVAAGQPVLMIQELGRVKVTVGLPDTEVGRVRAGQTAEVRVDGFPGRAFRALVFRVAPAARGVTRSFPVEVEIDAADREGLRPGMFAWIDIHTGDPERRKVVPIDAVVVRPDGRRVVLVLAREGDSVVEREVTVGRVRVGALEVLGGLEGDEQIVVAGQGALASGDRVRVLPSPGPAAVAVAPPAGADE